MATLLQERFHEEQDTIRGFEVKVQSSWLQILRMATVSSLRAEVSTLAAQHERYVVLQSLSAGRHAQTHERCIRVVCRRMTLAACGMLEARACKTRATTALVRGLRQHYRES
jgi:hypothetical protein